MNEETLNASLRKFLKTVGVTAQREIEIAIRKAIADKRLDGTESLAAKAKISVAGIDLNVEIESQLELR